MMKHRSVDILVVVAITIVAVTLAFTVTPDNVAARILTLPLVLILPGYALISAVFPSRVLGIPERLLFSLSLSLVIVVLGGLVLNWTPFGLRASSWSVLLGGITLSASAVALLRRREQDINGSEWLRIKGIGLTFRQWLLLSLAVVITCGAIVVSMIGAARQPFPGFTQLWILPMGRTNPKNAVRLGVRNMESTVMEYRLDVDMDGKVVKVWPSIGLRPNEQWEATLVLPQTSNADGTQVEAILYRADTPTQIYRHVVLWLGT
jgi:uncharacterized membrane protein